MCLTDCGKRIYFMLSGWFSSSSGLFHTQLFCCMFVSHPRGCLGACVCVYIYWLNLRMYVHILQVYTHEVMMCVDRCCTRSSHVFEHMFVYIHAGFTCIYLRICAQSSQVWVYVYVYAPKGYMCMCIYYVYTQSSHVRVNMIANIHIEFTYVFVYFGVYSHGVYMCVCTCFRICTQNSMCMCIW